jgi:hypothetical protein
MRRTLGFAAALLIGCAAGTATSQYLSSPANAAAPAGVPRWQQYCADNYDDDDLSRVGAQGWELVGLATSEGGLGRFAATRFCFKRPM